MRERLSELVTGALTGWVRMVTQRPALVVVAALASLGVALPYVLGNLAVNTDTRDMFSDELPYRVLAEDFRRSFPQLTDTLLVVVESPDGTRAHRTAQNLVTRCAAEPALFTSVYHAGSEPFLREHGLLFLETEALRELAAELAPLAPFFDSVRAEPTLAHLAGILAIAVRRAGSGGPPEALEGILDGLDRAIAAADGEQPLDWRPTLGAGTVADPTTQLVVLQPDLDYSSMVPGEAALTRLREITAELRAGAPDVRVRITGEVALAADELESARVGAIRAGILSLLLVTTLLVVGLRSVRMVGAALVTLLVGLAWTGAFAALAVGHLNLISIAFAVLYISLGIDYSIHFCLRYREQALTGTGNRQAVEGVVADVGRSLVLATVTTTLGFLAFVPTNFQGVAEMGLIAGGGMVINLIASLTLLPALLALPVLRPRPRASERSVAAPGAHLLDGIVRRARQVRFAALGLAGLSLVAVLYARFNPDPIHLRDASTESVSTYRDLTADSRTTPYRLSVLAPPSLDTVIMEESLRALPEVAAVIDIDRFIPADQDRKREVLTGLRRRFRPGPVPEVQPAEDPTPTMQALGRLRAALTAAAHEHRTSQKLERSLRLLLERLASASLQERLHIVNGIQAPLLDGVLANLGGLLDQLAADRLAATDLPASFRARWVTPDGRLRVEIRPREDLSSVAALRRFVSAVRTVSADATGSAAIFHDAGDEAVRSFRHALVYALVAIALVVLVVMGRPRDVLLVLGPLVLAALLTGAGAALVGIEFNFANLIGLPLLLGIGVDNGIHMVHRYRVAAPDHGNILRTSTARAVLFSSLTTLGGFGTLVVSPHPGTASLGALLCLGIAAGLFCTLVVLPALLVERTGNAA